MKTEIIDDDGDAITVEAGNDSIAADGEVRLFARATDLTIPHDEPAAVRRFAPAQARTLSAVLLRAADEAEGRERGRESGYEMAIGAVSPAYSGKEAEDSAHNIVTAVESDYRAYLASFIRDNIDMKGLDFADDEDFATWLEAQG